MIQIHSFFLLLLFYISVTATHKYALYLRLKSYFDAPDGDDPIALRMTGMQKGVIWVNGINLGRYWVSYLSAIDKPTQEE